MLVRTFQQYFAGWRKAPFTHFVRYTTLYIQYVLIACVARAVKGSNNCAPWMVHFLPYDLTSHKIQTNRVRRVVTGCEEVC